MDGVGAFSEGEGIPAGIGARRGSRTSSLARAALSQNHPAGQTRRIWLWLMISVYTRAGRRQEEEPLLTRGVLIAITARMYVRQRRTACLRARLRSHERSQTRSFTVAVRVKFNRYQYSVRA